MLWCFSAVSILANARPGSFVVRNSTSLPGAFALALRVAHLPPNKASKGEYFICRGPYVTLENMHKFSTISAG